MKPLTVALILALATGALAADRPRALDGDTVRHDGRIYRLVGFDTPETGNRASCAAERDAGERAAARLRELIATARHLALDAVPCSCRPGTEGTALCNYGRACGVLTINGRDAGDILIHEGLARRYTCGPHSCPRRAPWCEQ